MKTFTSNQFSRRPAEVYEAAREDGAVEVTHDRFKGNFIIHYQEQGCSTIRIRNKMWLADLVEQYSSINETGSEGENK